MPEIEPDTLLVVLVRRKAVLLQSKSVVTNLLPIASSLTCDLTNFGYAQRRCHRSEDKFQKERERRNRWCFPEAGEGCWLNHDLG